MQTQKRRTDRVPSDMRQYNFRAPATLIAEFTAACEGQNETPAVMLRDLMRLYVMENPAPAADAASEVHHG